MNVTYTYIKVYLHIILHTVAYSQYTYMYIIHELVTDSNHLKYLLCAYSTFDRKLNMKLKEEEQEIPVLRPHPDYRYVTDVLSFQL